MKLLELFLDLLFPPKCHFCRCILPREKGGICEDCRQKLVGMPISVEGTSFRKCVMPLRYEGSVRQAITRFKFNDHPEYADSFGLLLAAAIQSELAGEYDLITWIPVSRQRLRTRGYDQAGLLAEAAAKAMGESVVSTLEKVRDNSAQSGMDSADRRKNNVREAYAVSAPEAVTGKRILLIDDILTTGATMNEAAQTLLTAGARSVICAALAYTAKKF